MPTVTAIKPQKNNKRVNIFLDGKFGFGLDLENFVKLGLKVEQELSDKEIVNIVKKAEFQKTWDKLLRFAMTRPRSEKEVKDWFKRKKVPDQIHAELKKKLTKLELLNDSKFAIWWVGQRQQFRPKAKRILQQELLMKGITKDIISEVLVNTSIDEYKIAQKDLAKRAYKWKNLEGREKKQKMSEYLLRKGFGWDLVKNAVADYIVKEQEA